MGKTKGGKFLLGGLLGAAAGMIGGILLAPKSGKAMRRDIAKLALDLNRKVRTRMDETRRRVKNIFGEVSEEAVTKYKEIRDAVMARVAAIKTTGAEIDKTKYEKVVDEVVNEFKGISKKVAIYLKKDWEKVKKALT